MKSFSIVKPTIGRKIKIQIGILQGKPVIREGVYSLHTSNTHPYKITTDEGIIITFTDNVIWKYTKKQEH